MIAGDVVMLKSGGPQMTVTSVDTNALGTLLVFCVWFEGNKPIEASFPAITVVRNAERGLVRADARCGR